MDTLIQLKIIDFYCTFQYLLDYRSIDYYDINPTSYTPNSTVYCPFHDNKDTKAAKLYPKEEDNKSGYISEKLYCFSENRLYYPHSLLTPPKSDNNTYKYKSIVPYTPDYVFSHIWYHLPDCDKKYWSTIHPDLIPTSNKYSPLYKEYREGKISLFDLLPKLI